jgi:hypothetical protein
MEFRITWVFIVFALLTIVSCGGGGSNDGESNGPPSSTSQFDDVTVTVSPKKIVADIYSPQIDEGERHLRFPIRIRYSNFDRDTKGLHFGRVSIGSISTYAHRYK